MLEAAGVLLSGLRQNAIVGWMDIRGCCKQLGESPVGSFTLFGCHVTPLDYTVYILVPECL